MAFWSEKALRIDHSELYGDLKHIHLLVFDEKREKCHTAIDQIDRRENAQEHNQRKKRKGSFWEDRYHATAVESEEHLLQCLTTLTKKISRIKITQLIFSLWSAKIQIIIYCPTSVYSWKKWCLIKGFAGIISNKFAINLKNGVSGVAHRFDGKFWFISNCSVVFRSGLEFAERTAEFAGWSLEFPRMQRQPFSSSASLSLLTIRYCPAGR